MPFARCLRGLEIFLCTLRPRRSWSIHLGGSAGWSWIEWDRETEPSTAIVELEHGEARFVDIQAFEERFFRRGEVFPCGGYERRGCCLEDASGEREANPAGGGGDEGPRRHQNGLGDGEGAT